ncbi:MAG: nucleotidyltransferase family protein [Candidatus Diapherotrites archaeon]|nr:nucleotidyltransferase family protein [Candidatus Diapherotrites archaeon]
MEKIETAFILAGGKGTRLKPLTYEIPKPLIPINDKPILMYNIDNVKAFGVKTAILGVGHMAEKIKKYFANNPPGIEIIFSEEKQALGTGGALKLAQETGLLNKTFIMCNGDELKDIDYGKVASTMEQNQDIAGIALTATEDVSNFGVVELSHGKIKNFIEKPDPKTTISHLINTGAYVMTPKIFEYIQPEKTVNIEREVFTILAKEGKLSGAIACNAFYPIDTLDRYEHALLNWKRTKD